MNLSQPGCLADLTSKGYVVIRDFLPAAELESFKQDAQRPLGAGRKNENYDVVPISQQMLDRFEPLAAGISNAARRDAAIDTDLTVGGGYFSTGRGISFPWHQDHESFFLYQDHSHYLNLYIPLVKPDSNKSGVCLIPFDQLLARWPAAAQQFVGGGASRFVPTGDSTTVLNDETDQESTLPFNVESIAVTPQISARDLLLFRGDMIHRTQDTSTERLAVSIRRQRSGSVVDRRRLLGGGRTKWHIVRNNAFEYESLLQCFTESQCDSLTVGHLIRKLRDRAAARHAQG